MRILIYSYEFPPMWGGAGTYSYELASALQRAGHEIEVVSLRQTKKDDEFDQQCGLKVHRMETWQSEQPLNHHFLMKVYLNFHFDVVLVADRRAVRSVANMSLPFFPYFVTVHGSEVWSFFDPQIGDATPAERILYRRMLQKAQAIIAVSKATADLLLSYVPEVRSRLHVVHNGIDVNRHQKPSPELVESLRERLNLQSKPIALCISRINIDKGHDVLIDSFAQVVKQIPEAVLLIGGEGPLLDECKEQVARRNLQCQVVFLGEIPEGEISVYYQMCDLFVLPSRCESRWEGFGLVFLEANCYEKPVIGGAAGGVPEAIEEGVNGLLVDPYDVPALAAAMLKLFSDVQLRQRLGQQGFKRVHENFTSDRMGKDTWRVMEETLNGDSHHSPKNYPAKKYLRVSYWMCRIAVMSSLLRISKVTGLFKPL